MIKNFLKGYWLALKRAFFHRNIFLCKYVLWRWRPIPQVLLLLGLSFGGQVVISRHDLL